MISRFAVAAACLAVLAGCTSGGRDAAWTDEQARSAAQAVLARQGAAGDLSAQLSMRFAAPDAEPATFTVLLWAAADGRTRLMVRKVDVPVLTAVVAADGSMLAKDERHGAWYRGPAGDGLVADLGLLVDELRWGPIRADRPVRAGPAEGVVEQDAPLGRARITIDQAQRSVSEKQILDTDGRVLLHLRYATTQAFGDIARPAGVQLTVRGDAIDRRARVVRLDAVPAIDPARFRLEAPADARWLAWRDFLDGIGQ